MKTCIVLLSWLACGVARADPSFDSPGYQLKRGGFEADIGGATVALSSKDAALRLAATKFLLQAPSSRAVTVALGRASRDQNALVRTYAARALVLRGDRSVRVLDSLRSDARSSFSVVSTTAARTLADAGDRAGFERIEEMYFSGSGNQKRMAADHYFEIFRAWKKRDPDAEIEACLRREDDRYVRIACLAHVAAVGDKKRALALYRIALEDKEASIREAARSRCPACEK